MSPYKEADVGEIADLMRNQKDLEISTCILVGAGVSASAGIPDAKGIMDDLREKYPEIMRKAKSESYSEYMSLLADGVRRQLIRDYIKNCRLSKSFLCLAKLVKEGYIDRILTTNFDPLIEKALSLYGCRPSVYDFASSPIFIPGVVPGLALLYLHGRSDGFLLLNTEQEVNSLTNKLGGWFQDSNMRRAWIVIGYSGNDKPVFNSISNLDSYQYGLYWVGYRNRDPSDHVSKHILSRRNTYFVRETSADAFFEKLVEKLGIRLDELFRPKAQVGLRDIDHALTNAGIAEAADLFNVSRSGIQCLAYRIYQERTGSSYLHRIFIKKSDFDLIEDEFNRNPNVNIIKALIKKKNLNLHLKKSHQFIPTVVGKDKTALEDDPGAPAVLHVQTSYIERNASPKGSGSETSKEPSEPVELLVTKYTTPVSVWGYLLDMTPKSGHPYSKAAEDLLKNESYRREVKDSISRFFSPFSHINLALARNGKRQFVRPLHSSKPRKLLRIGMVPENVCNYNCTFCCLTRQKSVARAARADSGGHYSDVVAALVKSGCQRVMITGGEPLLCARRELLATIRAISSVRGLTDFWICTNGSLLNAKMCSEMREAGLGKVVVTIAAETNEKYKAYTKQTDRDLDGILSNLKIAMDRGLRVKVDVPLNRSGIKNVKEFLILLEKLKDLGIKEVAYFQLHKTDMNKDVFGDLFVDQRMITWELARDNSWQILERENEQKVFYDGDIEIIIPARIHYETEHCKRNKCGDYCQGVYAAYLKSEKDDFVFRACHRELADNTTRVRKSEFKKWSEEKRTALFDKLWTWAYQKARPT